MCWICSAAQAGAENALPPDEADAGRAGQAPEASGVTERILIDEVRRRAA